MDKEWEEIAKEENKHFEMLKKRGCTYPDCDLTMKPDTKIEKVAITTTFYDCPKCKTRIGIVTLNPLNANQKTSGQRPQTI